MLQCRVAGQTGEGVRPAGAGESGGVSIVIVGEGGIHLSQNNWIKLIIIT